MFYRFAFALTGLFTACAAHPPPPVIEHPDPPPAATCASACKHFRAMGCKEGQPSPEGNTCEAICENLEKSGIVKLDLECVMASETCASAGACPAYVSVNISSSPAQQVLDAACPDCRKD